MSATLRSRRASLGERAAGDGGLYKLFQCLKATAFKIGEERPIYQKKGDLKNGSFPRSTLAVPSAKIWSFHEMNGVR